MVAIMQNYCRKFICTARRTNSFFTRIEFPFGERRVLARSSVYLFHWFSYAATASVHSSIFSYIFYRKPTEWNKLAKWLANYHLYSPQICWIAQVPRIYHLLKSSHEIENFQQFLDSIQCCNLSSFHIYIHPYCCYDEFIKYSLITSYTSFSHSGRWPRHNRRILC